MSSAHLVKFDSVKPADIEWRDGLPFSKEFNDVYFSKYGAVEESTHVFIHGNQLHNDWHLKNQTVFTIAELGFGSGLNFLNTALHWSTRNKKNNSAAVLNYISIEKRPFSIQDLKRTLALWPQFSEISAQLITNYPSTTYGRHQLDFASNNLRLTLLFMPVEEALNDLILESNARTPQLKIDHWFLDGFAPSKNQTMWSDKITEQLARLSKKSTRLATYSVAAIVKNPIRDAGFKITKLNGFAKKREMLSAIFEADDTATKQPKFINLKFEKPWFNYINPSLNSTTSDPSIAIIGGGIAGCSLAYALSQKGLACDIYEKRNSIASAASGAAAGIFHPQLTSDMNLSSQFNWQAYLALLRFLDGLSINDLDQLFIQRGLQRFLKDQQSTQELLRLTQQLHMQPWINQSQKFKQSQRCLQFDHAGAINIVNLCQLYLQMITTNTGSVKTNQTISTITRVNDQWKLATQNSEKRYQHIIYCGGAQSDIFKTFNNITTNTTRGQTCHLKMPSLASKLDQVICEQTYLVSGDSKTLHIGSSFDNFEDNNLNRQTQNDILSRTATFLENLNTAHFKLSNFEERPLKGTVGYRLHSMDRLPIVGPAFDHRKLTEEFKGFGQKRLIRASLTNYNQPGLWLNTAYGSHGLLYSLLASQHLANLINNEVSPLQKNIADAINPARFFIKSLK